MGRLSVDFVVWVEPPPPSLAPPQKKKKPEARERKKLGARRRGEREDRRATYMFVKTKRPSLSKPEGGNQKSLEEPGRRKKEGKRLGCSLNGKVCPPSGVIVPKQQDEKAGGHVKSTSTVERELRCSRKRERCR